MAERRPPGFNVDLGFYDSDEVLSIPRKIRAAAIGVWTLCGSYSANKLTDGYVSAEVLRDRGCTEFLRAALIKSDLWADAGDGAIQFGKWSKWQRTSAEIRSYREADAERKRAWRGAKKKGVDAHVNSTYAPRKPHVDVTYAPRKPHVDGDVDVTYAPRNDLAYTSSSGDAAASVRTDAGPSTPVRPESSYPRARTKTETKTEKEISTPVVELVGGSGGKGSRLPDGWQPPLPVVAQMRSDHPHVNLETEHAKFVDYWRAQPGAKGRKADWQATWRNWIRRAAEQTTNRNGRHLSTADQRVAQIQAMKTQPQRLEIE